MVTPDETIRDDILRHRGQSADEGIATNSAILVHCRQAADHDIVAHIDVTPQSRGVGQNDIVADIQVHEDDPAERKRLRKVKPVDARNLGFQF